MHLDPIDTANRIRVHDLGNRPLQMYPPCFEQNTTIGMLACFVQIVQHHQQTKFPSDKLPDDRMQREHLRDRMRQLQEIPPEERRRILEQAIEDSTPLDAPPDAD